MLSPDGVEGAQATRGLDVAHHAHHDHGRGLDDGDGLARLLLVQLGAGLVHIAQNVGAACEFPGDAGQTEDASECVRAKQIQQNVHVSGSAQHRRVAPFVQSACDMAALLSNAPVHCCCKFTLVTGHAPAL